MQTSSVVKKDGFWRSLARRLGSFGDALDGDVNPTWIEAWSYLKRGNAYDALGQRERAVAEYDKVISNGSNYDNAQQAAERYKAAPYTREKSTASN